MNENNIKAVVYISTTHTTDIILKRICEDKNIMAIYEITGKYDIMAIVSAKNINCLNQIIERIKKRQGIKSTNSILILQEFKQNE